MFNSFLIQEALFPVSILVSKTDTFCVSVQHGAMAKLENNYANMFPYFAGPLLNLGALRIPNPLYEIKYKIICTLTIEKKAEEEEKNFPNK